MYDLYLFEFMLRADFRRKNFGRVLRTSKSELLLDFLSVS